jgi:nicotinamidase-related amidase
MSSDLGHSVALFVIDVQLGLFHKTTKIYKEKEFLDNVNALIDRFHEKHYPVFVIRHSNESTLSEGSGEWQLHPEVHTQDSDFFMKKRISSALKENAILQKLKETNVKTLIMTGLVSHGCVKATCQEAIKLGYTVYLVEDGHSHFNKEGKKLVDKINEEMKMDGAILETTQSLLSKV